jgi:hypothetical protein
VKNGSTAARPSSKTAVMPSVVEASADERNDQQLTLHEKEAVLLNNLSPVPSCKIAFLFGKA